MLSRSSNLAILSTVQAQQEILSNMASEITTTAIVIRSMRDDTAPIKDDPLSNSDDTAPIKDDPLSNSDDTAPIKDDPLSNSDDTARNSNESNSIQKSAASLTSSLLILSSLELVQSSSADSQHDHVNSNTRRDLEATEEVPSSTFTTGLIRQVKLQDSYDAKLASITHSCRTLSTQPTTIRRWQNTKQVYKSLFGTLTISSESSLRRQGNLREQQEESTQIETNILLLPKTWLSRTGISLSLRRLYNAGKRSELQVSLAPSTIISLDNPVVQAIKSGSILRLKKLVGEGYASPKDILPDGKNLLQVCLEEMAYSVEMADGIFLKYISYGSDSDEFNGDNTSAEMADGIYLQSINDGSDSDEFYGDNTSAEYMKTFLAISKICKWLLAQGVDPYEANSSERYGHPRMHRDILLTLCVVAIHSSYIFSCWVNQLRSSYLLMDTSHLAQWKTCSRQCANMGELLGW
jgi:hypothetical protein